VNIVKLQIKNFLSITDVEVKPGQINQIVGQNNMGKSSILKAIEVAMKGSNDTSYIKHGANQAEIIIEFSDGMNLHRKINSSGSQTVKVSKNEMEAKTPQAFLNGLFETSAFNPLELLEPKRRVEALLQAIPVVVTEAQVTEAIFPLPAALPPTDYAQHGLKVLQTIGDYYYARRAEVNKQAKNEEERYRVLTEQFNLKPALEECLNTEEQLAEQKTKTALQIENIRAQEHEVSRKQGQLENAKRFLETNKTELALLEQKAESIRSRIISDEAHIVGLAAELKEQKPIVEIADLQEVLTVIEKERRILSQHRERVADMNVVVAQGKTAVAVKLKAEEFDRCVTTLRTTLKQKIMSEAHLPIPGITYQDGEFFLNGHAITMLSTSASMKLACAIARSLAKTSKIICLDGAESLDDTSYAELHKEIENDGFTYFISKVGEQFKGLTSDTVVVMSEGQVVS
jgi:AAA15 family ATPase/GTPase